MSRTRKDKDLDRGHGEAEGEGAQAQVLAVTVPADGAQTVEIVPPPTPVEVAPPAPAPASPPVAAPTAPAPAPAPEAKAPKDQVRRKAMGRVASAVMVLFDSLAALAVAEGEVVEAGVGPLREQVQKFLASAVHGLLEAGDLKSAMDGLGALAQANQAALLEAFLAALPPEGREVAMALVSSEGDDEPEVDDELEALRQARSEIADLKAEIEALRTAGRVTVSTADVLQVPPPSKAEVKKIERLNKDMKAEADAFDAVAEALGDTVRFPRVVLAPNAAAAIEKAKAEALERARVDRIVADLNKYTASIDAEIAAWDRLGSAEWKAMEPVKPAAKSKAAA